MSRLPLHLDLIPMDLVWADAKANIALMDSAIQARLRETPQIDPESRIFVFPEVSLTAFVTKDSQAVALPRTSEEVQKVRDLAKKYKTAVVFGFPEKAAGQEKPFNTILMVSPKGEDIADYQKLHLYTAGNPAESETYQCGDSGTLVSYRGWKIAFGICFDLRFPGMFQSYAREGADLVILPACWIGGPQKSDQFKTLSASRAIEGQCFFAALNRSGKDEFYSYEGEVLCFAPKGEALSGSAGFDLNPELVEVARKLAVRASGREEYPVVIC
jgi:predicted amidohydrolase